MIKRIFNWINSNKLTFVLMIVMVALLFGGMSGTVIPFGRTRDLYSGMRVESAIGGLGGGMGSPMNVSPKMMASDSYIPSPQAAPRPDIIDRKFVTNANYSLLVRDVTESLDNIKGKVRELNGYLVNVNVSRPELGENASIDFRVPSDQVQAITNYLREQSIKVVSENVSGYDVTDQYVDVDEYLSILTKNKARMEEILTSAKTVDEMLKVQTQLFSIQAQIDSYRGQLKYLEGTTATSLITVYISTDETGLPYTEPLSWRPEVIFKHAVRSLFGTIQSIGTAMIWLGVYSALIVPALTIVLIVILIRKRRNGREG